MTADAAPTRASLDVLSDPICPWCLIGKTRLEAAIAERGGPPPFAVTWRPFQLNPDMPAEGMDRRAYLEAKFGGPDGAAHVYGAIERAARDDGIEIDFAAIRRTPNTLDAHRLIRWSHAEDKQDAVIDGLFDRYFRRGEDISDHAVLLDTAAAAGLDGDAIGRLLSGDADRDAVRAEDAEARAAGVSGAPTFIVAGRHVVPGAQPAALWGRVIDELRSGALGA